MSSCMHEYHLFELWKITLQGNVSIKQGGCRDKEKLVKQYKTSTK